MVALEKEGRGIGPYASGGRGIGLLNKCKAYSLQDQGRIPEANLELGFRGFARLRDRSTDLADLGLTTIRL